MRKMLCFLSALVLLVSCQEDVTLELPPYKSKLVVYCIVQPNYYPILFLSRSKGYFDYSDTSREYEYITGATVVLTNITENVTDTLKYLYGDVRMYGGSGFTKKHHYKSAFVPKEGEKYILNVWYGSEHVFAETEIPRPPLITYADVSLDGENTFPGSKTGQFRIKCKNSIQNPVNSVFIFGYGPGNSGVIYNNDEYFYPLKKEAGAENEINVSGPVADSHEEIAIYLYTLTQATAQFFETIHSQSENQDNPFMEPLLIKSNITGGLGCFGAVSDPSTYTIKL